MGSMCGWLRCEARSISRRKRSGPSAKLSSDNSTFIATLRLCLTSFARYTVAMAPRPSSRSISYRPLRADRRRSRVVGMGRPTIRPRRALYQSGGTVALATEERRALDARPSNALEVSQTGENVAGFRSIGRSQDARQVQLVDYSRGATITHLEPALEQRRRT